MQALIFLLIGLSGVGIAAAGWYALGISVIEAVLAGALFSLLGLIVHERAARRQAEVRLDKALTDLRSLLATDARAGHVLSQRVKVLDDLDMGGRMDVVEADMSVLGTVVRQVAEAVSELESQAARGPSKDASGGESAPLTDLRIPSVPLPVLRRALEDGSLVHHAEPIVTLPQRRLVAYHMVARLELEESVFSDPPDYMPVRNAEGDIVIRRLERICTEQAIRTIRRARMNGDPVKLWLDMSRASLSSTEAMDQIVAILSANRAVNPDLCFAIDAADWLVLDKSEQRMIDRLVEQGVGMVLRDAPSLRHDFSNLSRRGVRYVSVDARTFTDSPSRLTDFHSADIDDYMKRFGIDLVMSNVRTEQQILTLLDDRIRLALGPAIGPAGPLREDLREAENDTLRSAAAR
ncbi:EAL domain-containing protein [Pelagibacterium montanilacus]|uniref:EAL domain-containing protein n=1 Tax=Pelagibacterium montanilacus TaxID=2185280 RepID=UPI000F8DA58E|nr:EAL domain-containing protein [Pelagibacterium montanilacus]